MSIIIHRCINCTHRESEHADTSCSYMQCRCSIGRAHLGAPEVIPTFDGNTSALIDTIHQPGTTWNAGTGHRVYLCNCAACQDLYRERTSA